MGARTLFWISGRLASKTSSTLQMSMHPFVVSWKAPTSGLDLDHKDGILCLCHAVEAVTIPVSFKKNSLFVDAHIMMVQGEVPEVRPVKESRIVVDAGFDLHARGAEWSCICGSIERPWSTAMVSGS